MQQGLITKIEKKFMVIKTEASDIERIKIRPKVKVGEKIEYTKRDIYRGFNRFTYKQAGASLSVLIMMALVGGLIVTQFNQNRSYGVVSFDVNPSINIEINENSEIINTKQLNESDIVPENYTDYTLLELLSIITTNAVEANLLEPDQIILLSYTPINDNAPLSNEAVEAYINQVKADYTVLYYSADKAYYDVALDSHKTVGRYYFDEQLKKLDLIVEESSDYIQDAYNVLQEKAPEVIENIRVNPPVDSTKPDDTSTEDSTTEDSNQEDTVTDPVDDTTDDNTVDDTTTDTPDEDNTDEVDEQKRQEAIAAQKLIVDQSYNIYKTNKSTADTALVDVNNTKNELAAAAELLISQQAKYNNVNDAKQENISEKNSISKRLETDKATDLAEAQNIKDQSIAAQSDIKSEIKSLNKEASELYDNAYEQHKLHMDVTVEQIIEVQSPLQTQIDELANGTTTQDPATIQEIELLQGIVNDFDTMIDIIYSLSGTLPQADYQFIGLYNQAYLEFDAVRFAANKLEDQASSLEDEYDEAIEDAEAVYQETLTSIDAKYVSDYKKLNEIQELLDGFEVVLPNFLISIDNAQVAVDTLNGSLEELTALYNQLKLKQDQSYQLYIKEKDILDQLESKD